MKYLPLLSRYGYGNPSNKITIGILKIQQSSLIYRIFLFIPMIILIWLQLAISVLFMFIDIILLIPRIIYLSSTDKYNEFDAFKKDISRAFKYSDPTQYTSKLKKYDIKALYNKYRSTESDTFYTILMDYTHHKKDLTKNDLKVYEKLKSFLPYAESYIKYYSK